MVLDVMSHDSVKVAEVADGGLDFRGQQTFLYPRVSAAADNNTSPDAAEAAPFRGIIKIG